MTEMSRPERIAEDRGAALCRALADFEAPLLRYATRMLGDDQRGRDVVQEAFLRLCREADPAALDGRMKPWLFRVARQRAIDYLRKEGRMQSLVGTEESLVANCAHGAGDPARGVETQEAAGTAAAAVGRLPEREQELIRLKFEHGLSYREMAETTGLSVSNVGYLLHMAIKKLRADLGDAAETA